MATHGVEIIDWGGWRIVWLDSSSESACRRLLETEQVDGVGVSVFKGFPYRDILFLRGWPNLKGLVIPDARGIDVTAVASFERLAFLTLGEARQPVDLSGLSRLHDLRLHWSRTIGLPVDGQATLRALVLAGYTPETGDLSGLPLYPSLQRITLTQCRVTSLDGVNRYPLLQYAEFNYLNQLRCVRSLAGTHLEELVFEGCKKITDLDSLSSLASLRSLRLIRCGAVPKLEFFRRIEKFVIQSG